MRMFLIVLVFSLPQNILACPALEGKWQSSLEHFKKFNGRWANIDEKPLSFMLQTQGNEMIEYNSNKIMEISRNASEIKIGERKIETPAFSEKVTYQILGCTNDSVAIKFNSEKNLKISLLNFQDENTYWIYASDPESENNSHIREYYTRM